MTERASVIDTCNLCGEQTVVYGAGEPTPISGVCIARVWPLVDDAETDRALHDRITHPWPVEGCERCKVRR